MNSTSLESRRTEPEATGELIDTLQPVIARFEDADYEGHSLSMLQRIAEALGQRLEVSFVPATGRDG
jgi:hypothetical protein